MSLYRDEAVVLRTQKLGEADRIITLLTREHGRVRGVAKGVRRTKSKFGARLEPGSHVDIQLYTGRTFDTVTQVESISNYGEALTDDYSRWTIAGTILEAAERFTSHEHEPALQEFKLVTGALKALAEDKYDPSMILDAYLLRSLAVGGYAPALVNCSKCDAPFTTNDEIGQDVYPTKADLIEAMKDYDWQIKGDVALCENAENCLPIPIPGISSSRPVLPEEIL